MILKKVKKKIKLEEFTLDDILSLMLSDTGMRQIQSLLMEYNFTAESLTKGFLCSQGSYFNDGLSITDDRSGYRNINSEPSDDECNETYSKNDLFNLIPKSYCPRRIRQSISCRYSLICLIVQLQDIIPANMDNDSLPIVPINCDDIVSKLIVPSFHISQCDLIDNLFHYQYSDGSHGILCRDKTNLLLFKNKDLYYISEKGSVDYYDDLEHMPAHLCKKVNDMRIFNNKVAGNYNNEDLENSPDIPYLVKCVKTFRATALYFSNGCMEIHIHNKHSERRLILAPLLRAISYGKVVNNQVVFTETINDSEFLKDLCLARTLCRRALKSFSKTMIFPFWF